MPQEVNDLAKVLSSVIPVLAGGFIGILGSFGVNYLQQRQKRSEKLKDKAEEALKYFYQSFSWLYQHRRQCLIGNEILPDILPPLDLAEAIISLYFPEAEPALEKFTVAYSEVTSVTMDLGGERMTRGKIPEDHREQWNAANENLKSEFRVLKDKLRELSLS